MSSGPFVASTGNGNISTLLPFPFPFGVRGRGDILFSVLLFSWMASLAASDVNRFCSHFENILPFAPGPKRTRPHARQFTDVGLQPISLSFFATRRSWKRSASISLEVTWMSCFSYRYASKIEDNTALRSVIGDDARFRRNARRTERNDICEAARRPDTGVEDVKVRSLVNISWTTTRNESSK